MFDILNADDKFRYQLLSRMKSDCDYFLGYGNRNENALWAGNIVDQIETMKALYKSFNEAEAPEWLTWEDILNYEKEMRKQHE